MNLITRALREAPETAASDPWDAFDRVLQTAVSPLVRRAAGLNSNGGFAFTPPVDLSYDAENGIVVSVELPGVKKEDVEITIQDDALTIKGAKKNEAESKEGRYHYVERRYGEFLRTFQLPAAVNAAEVKADYKDGILTIHMPIAEEAKPRKIDISIN